MKIYGSLTSPYVRKVRIFLAEKGQQYDLVVEGPSDAAGNIARLNPLGKVPLLIRDDDEVLFDSIMIIEYLDALSGISLIPSGDERWRAQRWHFLGQGIMRRSARVHQDHFGQRRQLHGRGRFEAGFGGPLDGQQQHQRQAAQPH